MPRMSKFSDVIYLIFNPARFFFPAREKTPAFWVLLSLFPAYSYLTTFMTRRGFFHQKK